MVPPPLGCGWQMRAAKGASGWPSLRSASRRPSGPGRSKPRIMPCAVESESAPESAGAGSGEAELVLGKSDLSGLVLFALVGMPDLILSKVLRLRRVFWLNHGFAPDCFLCNRG